MLFKGNCFMYITMDYEHNIPEEQAKTCQTEHTVNTRIRVQGIH